MFSNNVTSNNVDSKVYNIFIFQPEGVWAADGKPAEGFYALSFIEKINILKEKIIAAKEYIKKESYATSSKSIFVAPEYLFKNFSNNALASKRYYSKDEKNTFKKVLTELSQDTDLILAPGTICWKKTSEDNKIYFRNIIYFVHRGILKKYKKYNPDMADTDFYNDFKENGTFIKGVKNFYRKGTYYYKGPFLWDILPDNNLIELNDLLIGIEICNDHGQRQLKNKVSDSTKIDIHLIAAAGLCNIETLRNAVLTVKVDANHNWDKHPKSISFQNDGASKDLPTYGNPTESSGDVIDIVNNLKCHRFKL